MDFGFGILGQLGNRLGRFSSLLIVARISKTVLGSSIEGEFFVSAGMMYTDEYTLNSNIHIHNIVFIKKKKISHLRLSEIRIRKNERNALNN